MILQSASERLRDAVLCVCSAARPGTVVGTAFAIAPGWLLTCAHVVKELGDSCMQVDDRSGFKLLPGPPQLPHDPTVVDLALLPVESTLEGRLLPCYAGPVSSTGLVTRGYAPVAGADGRGGRELRFAPRGQVQVDYDVYTITNAFELSNDMAEGGFSGAPLFDVAAGAVVGAVSSGIESRERSWAVPLAGATFQWPELAEALSWNAAHLPRFGRSVNAAGVRFAASLQAVQAVERQGSRGKFIPKYHVVRPELPHEAARFVGGDAASMAVMGGANTGKTWSLCDLARNPAGPPTLLLVAGDLPRDAAPALADFVAAAVRIVWPTGPDLPEPPEPSAMAQAMVAESQRLLVLLDAVNEALDVRGFTSGWLAEAVAWAKSSGAKLLFTTRPEPWPMLARTLPPDQLFAPDASAGASAEMRVLRLGDFTELQAAQALKAYGLDPAWAGSLSRLPLMFRLAAGRSGGPGQLLGLVRLVDAYVQSYLDEAAQRLGRVSTGQLGQRVRNLAAAVVQAPAGSLAVPTNTALDILGSDEMLDALLATGLLAQAGAAGEAVRFTYDQIAESTALADQTASFATAESALDLRRAACTLLRREADGDEIGFMTAFGEMRARLISAATAAEAIDEMLERMRRGIRWPAAAAAYVARSLPPSRNSLMTSIYDMLIECAPSLANSLAFEDLVGWLLEAPLAPAQRAAMLLAIAPCADRYDFRLREWQEGGQRATGVFRRALSRPANIAGALAVLLARDPNAVRPLLAAALSDTRPINEGRPDSYRAEADVASLAAGVLAWCCHDKLGPLLDRLFESHTDMGFTLLADLAKTEGARVFEVAVASLDRKDPLPALFTLRKAAAAATKTAQVAAVEQLNTMLGPGQAGLEAAAAIRELDPSHLLAWDRVAADVDTAGAHLAPVPPERFAAALGLVNEAGGFEWMQHHDGPEHEQIKLVERLIELLPHARIGSRLGRLMEIKLQAFATGEQPHLRPWADFGRHLAAEGDEASRICLIYGVFSGTSAVRQPELNALAEIIIETVCSGQEAQLIISEMLQFSGLEAVTFLPFWKRLRQSYPTHADVVVAGRNGLSASVREGVLAYWAQPNTESTWLSRALQALLRSGTPLTEAFSRNTYLNFEAEEKGKY